VWFSKAVCLLTAAEQGYVACCFQGLRCWLRSQRNEQCPSSLIALWQGSCALSRDLSTYLVHGRWSFLFRAINLVVQEPYKPQPATSPVLDVSSPPIMCSVAVAPQPKQTHVGMEAEALPQRENTPKHSRPRRAERRQLESAAFRAPCMVGPTYVHGTCCAG
jgi:hypothetical protein